MGGCGELASSLSYGIRTVVLRFFMGPCESSIATSARLLVFAFLGSCMLKTVPCAMLLACVFCDIECIGLNCT